MSGNERSAEHPQPDKATKRPFLGTPAGIVLCAFLAVAGLFLWLERRDEVAGALPLLLPLAICLGMHFFMHRRRHGGGEGHRE